MTTNVHTDIAIGAPANASVFNAPLGQLDQVVSDLGLNAKFNGAKLDGVTDDTAAWYNGSTGVLDKVPASGAVVNFGPGVSIISSSIFPKARTVIQGAGRNTSVFKGTAGFSGDHGLIEYTGNLAYCELRNVGFDMTAVTSSVPSAVHQITGSLQHFVADDIFGDLTGPTSHQLFYFEQLGGGGAANPSYDLSFNNLFAHNGAGTVQIYLNPTATNCLMRDIAIRNVFDLVDVPVTDDRIAIAGNASFAGGEVRNVLVDGHFVQVAASVASGMVNGVKFDTGAAASGTYIHNMVMRNLFYRNLSPSVVTGSPVLFFWTTPGTIQDYLIDGVFATGSARLKVFLVRGEAAPLVVLSNIVMRGCWDTVYCIEIFNPNVPVGDEIVIVEKFTLSGSASLGTDTPVGVGFTATAASGGTGMIRVSDGWFGGVRSGVSNMITEGGANIATSAWSNFYLYRMNTLSVTKPFTNLVNNFVIADNPGYNPHGAVTTPGIVTTLVTNQTGVPCAVYITTGATNAVTQVNINGVNTTQTVPISTTAKMVGVVPPLGTIQITGTLTGTTWLWVGVG